MSIQTLRTVGFPLFLSLAIVMAVSGSGRLFKANLDQQKAEAAQVKTSAVACVEDLIPVSQGS